MILLFSILSFAARVWNPIVVPGGICGDGSPYQAFVSEGAKNKIAYYVQGGNACWSRSTCHGWFAYTNMSTVEVVTAKEAIFSNKETESAIHDWTIVYLPYCTGDVHLGEHEVSYDGKKTFHTGKLNIREALKTIHPLYPAASTDSVLLLGISAGAIGAIYHLKEIEKYYSEVSHKTMIADSPGLHFGEKFWHKFPENLLADYSTAMNEMGTTYDYNSGMVADISIRQCQNFSDWHIGYMQASKDKTMSDLFGAIKQKDHRNLIYGPTGIFELTASQDDTCSAWVPDIAQHTFLSRKRNVNVVAGGVSAMEYVDQIIRFGAQSNYK